MSVHMKKQTTGESTEISLTVPSGIADKVLKVMKDILELADLHETDDDDQLYSIDEVFPDASPGMALRGLRAREGITQKQLADLIKIKQTRVSEMENGIRPISVEMAKKIGKAFGVSYKVFL